MSRKKKGQMEMTGAERRALFLARLGESLTKIKKNQGNVQRNQQRGGREPHGQGQTATKAQTGGA